MGIKQNIIAVMVKKLVINTLVHMVALRGNDDHVSNYRGS
ncbi:hypothetical protein CLORAM_02084 [Thomasclavelia ramosa DSM 1402]|uniref:Uncharacterized protein n=1 Tax=Thomasclavelia ramosa DSM 1402 TaxID=445974 RepID=B0N663_9FIRM|nr:hypothetical protein CLORAM_02084 [Thomasclavelia ramosa DSM 1402]